MIAGAENAVRRIDLVLGVLAATCGGYLWAVENWQTAVVGLLMFALFVMIGLWFL